MTVCWAPHKSNRPSFAEIVKELDILEEEVRVLGHTLSHDICPAHFLFLIFF